MLSKLGMGSLRFSKNAYSFVLNLYTLESECIIASVDNCLSENSSKSVELLPGALNGIFIGVADGCDHNRIPAPQQST